MADFVLHITVICKHRQFDERDVDKQFSLVLEVAKKKEDAADDFTDGRPSELRNFADAENGTSPTAPVNKPT